MCAFGVLEVEEGKLACLVPAPDGFKADFHLQRGAIGGNVNSLDVAGRLARVPIRRTSETAAATLPASNNKASRRPSAVGQYSPSSTTEWNTSTRYIGAISRCAR